MFFSRQPRRGRPEPAFADVSRYSRRQKEAIVALAEQLSHPWYGYAPTPVVHAFHRSQSTLRYIVAASQSGKTVGCAREAWMYACDCHPYRIVPRVSGMGVVAVGSVEGTASVGVLTALWNTRPAHEVDWERTKWDGPTHWPPNGMIHLRNGNVVKIVSSRGGSTGAASIQADWVWVDEPPKRDKFSELMARVTQTDGHVWLSFTPYDSEQDLTWLRLYLEGDPERGLLPESPGWERFCMELSVENCPWMTEEQVARVWAQTPPWVADQRLRGSWDTPPVGAYFVLDQRAHDLDVPFVGGTVGPWVNVASADHGELAGHQHVVFMQVRKVVGRPVRAELRVVGEYVSTGRTSVEDDARGVEEQLRRVARGLDDAVLAVPSAWRWVGDVNSAGKGLAGISVNEALAEALGMRRDAFDVPDKGAGSVDRGLVLLRAALDARPSPIRIASGSTGVLGAPVLWRALSRHRRKNDHTKHAVDALRYGATPYLDPGSAEVRRLPDPARPRAFAPLIGVQ